MERVTANGIDFAYLEAGPDDGRLALCLHGFPDRPETWSDLLPRLADAGFHAVAPFLRGYAPTSPAPDGSYHVADLALDAIALADALADRAREDVGKPVLIGHDWGAIATWTAAALAPERWARVVAMAVPHAGVLGAHLLDVEIIRNCWYQYVFQTPLAELVVPADDFHLIDVLWADWSPGFTPDPDHLRAVKDTLATPGVLEAALGYYRATLGGAWVPPDEARAGAQAAMVGTVTVPALSLHGTRDGIYPPRAVEADTFRTFVPEVEIDLVEGTGHFLHLEQPEAVGARVVEYVGARPPGA